MKVGIVTFNDGRKRVAQDNEKACLQFQRQITGWLKRQKHQVIEAPKVVWNHATARRAAAKLMPSDVVVFNFCVWSYPDLTAQVANLLPSMTPILQLGNINPSRPGWVAFFASAGALAEIDRPFGRVLGDIKNKKVQAEVQAFLRDHEPDQRLRGYRAAAALHGQRYGEFDGPSNSP